MNWVITLLVALIAAAAAWFWFKEEKPKHLLEISGISIMPADEILQEVADDIINMVETTGNEIDATVIYRGMILGYADAMAETTAKDGKEKKRYYIIHFPKGGTVRKKEDLLLIIPENYVQFGNNSILIDANANLYPITDNVFFAGDGFNRFAEFVNFRAIKEMLGDMAQVQAKYYALTPQVARELEELRELMEMKKQRIREVI